jgi:uncharacterized protein
MKRNAQIVSPQALFGFIIAFFVVWTLRVLFLSVTLNPPQPPWWLELIGTLVKWSVWVLPVLVQSRFERTDPILFLRLRPRAAHGLLVGFVVGIVYGGAMLFLQTVFVRANLNLGALLSLPQIILSAALPEEILFRGFLLRQLETRLPFWSANLWSAALFLASHFAGWTVYGLWSVQVTIVVFAVGLICGVLVQRTGSLWSAIALHTINNLTTLIGR